MSNRSISWSAALRDLKADRLVRQPIREERLRNSLLPGQPLSAWRGCSGRRYVVAVHAPADLTSYAEINDGRPFVAILVLVDAAGTREPDANVVDSAASLDYLVRCAVLAEIAEVHVHRLCDDLDACDDVVRDLRAEPAPAAPNSAHPTPATCAEIGCAEDRAEPLAAAPLPLEPGEIAAELADAARTPIALRRSFDHPWTAYEVRFLADGYGAKAGDVQNFSAASIRLVAPIPDGWCPARDAYRARRAAMMADEDELFVNDPVTRARDADRALTAAVHDRGAALAGMVPQVCQQQQADAGAAVTKAHTPGPWVISDKAPDARRTFSPSDTIEVRAGAGGSGLIACLYASNWMQGGMDVANARLIVSAPDLLAALRDARDNGLIYWEPNTERGHVAKAEMLARIDAALARAEGRSL